MTVKMMNDLMSIGKYKGCPLSEVPGEYLKWLLGEPWVFGGLKEQFKRELERRRNASLNRRRKRQVLALLEQAFEHAYGLRSVVWTMSHLLGGEKDKAVSASLRSLDAVYDLAKSSGIEFAQLFPELDRRPATKEQIDAIRAICGDAADRMDLTYEQAAEWILEEQARVRRVNQMNEARKVRA